MRKRIACLVFTAFAAFSARAQEASPALQACLQKADRMPDVAAAEADDWFRHAGGGNDARLCRAVAQFNRSEFAKAGDDFAVLAAARKNEPHRSAMLHAQAALSYMRAEKSKKSEAEYDAALKLEPQEPDIWVDRAVERAAAERFWDAISDLNKALDIMPDMPEALKLRGQVWTKLGLFAEARADFIRAAQVQAADEAAAAQAAKAGDKAKP